jgi:putative aminopeptidase FrvX
MDEPKIDADYLRKHLLELLAIPCPTGFTDEIVRYVSTELGRLGVEFEIARRGTIFATVPGAERAHSRVVVAHLDTIGATVSGLKPNGRLAIAPIGTWSSRFAEGGRVTVFSNGGSFRGQV